MSTSILFKAIRQAELAIKLGISPQAVGKWGAEIPPNRVLDCCQAAEWRCTPHELRTDIYPNPWDGLPPDVLKARFPDLVLPDVA